MSEIKRAIEGAISEEDYREEERKELFTIADEFISKIRLLSIEERTTIIDIVKAYSNNGGSSWL